MGGLRSSSSSMSPVWQRCAVFPARSEVDMVVLMVYRIVSAQFVGLTPGAQDAHPSARPGGIAHPTVDHFYATDCV